MDLSSGVAFAKEHPVCKDDEAKIIQLLVVFPYIPACLEGTGKHALPRVPGRMVFKLLTRQVLQNSITFWQSNGFWGTHTGEGSTTTAQ